ncbi:hypothetical protein PC120_g27901 [Phytophthora cactorum]|nr:hypothetical protein PC120_g27901 [Phytophthora cactorum]
MVRTCTIAGSGYSLDSSYTGSGLYVAGDRAYWGSGSNESDGLLGCFDVNTGALVGSKMTNSSLASFGVTPINGAAGCIQLNPTQPGIAYYFYFGTTLKTLFLTTLDVANTTIPTTTHANDLAIKFDITGDSRGSTVSATFRALINGTELNNFAPLLPLPVTNNSVIVPISLMNIGANTFTLELKDNYGGISTKVFTITVTNDQPSIVTSVSSATTHKENVVFEAIVTDEPTDLMTYRILLNDVPLDDWTVSGLK